MFLVCDTEKVFFRAHIWDLGFIVFIPLGGETTEGVDLVRRRWRDAGVSCVERAQEARIPKTEDDSSSKFLNRKLTSRERETEGLTAEQFARWRPRTKSAPHLQKLTEIR